MTPTLRIFSQALLTPDAAFATLAEARATTDTHGLPHIVRTSRFAEAEIEWQGERWLLFLPLNTAAVARIERTASALRRLNTPHLTSYRRLPGELRWTDATGTKRTADLVLQRIPPGMDFDRAMEAEPAETLLAALDTLRTALRELGFAHNNLKAENLRWTGGRFIPLRYHDATFGGAADTDAEAFDALRRRIAENRPETAAPGEVHDIRASYDPQPALTGHLWVGHAFEGLVCVEDRTGYGFVDRQNRVVIPARYRWAGDFREGRAEVETATGMGLIDREGREVIPPHYEIVDYDAAASLVRVRQKGRWALFDLFGRQLTPFGTKVE